ncbi:GTP cyclohydrolase 1 feedback regulatory protein-like [Dreissena polymorpha]|uniref:GTP cyclohydrolase 1 feedback regulatory protein n=1 Tax=Dreissena polymorpha TaxID=45954 RepID=A0A9D4R8Y5_DREPO|nr:GTP cyclohydrolase 1 feedback regulatory protein-like [Dreissena polymorpha]KAH3859469.1 hypothetical protein DPMN_102284 [Dreissena polymorpha]
MPYVIVSTQIRLECGPTTVGDEWSDKELMAYLGAELIQILGNNFKEYRTNDVVRSVLNKLELKGYKLVSSTGVGQTIVFSMYKPDSSICDNAHPETS